jgi:hypothetical protein
MRAIGRDHVIPRERRSLSKALGYGNMQDHLEPLLRLIFTGLIASKLALLFATKAIDVRIAAVGAAALTTSYQVAPAWPNKATLQSY